MKKVFVTVIASLACAFALAFPSAAFADSTVYSEGTLYYTVNNGSISIVGTFGKEQTVTVPSSIGGYPVNTIKANAFDSNPNLLEVQLPDTITTIEQGAIPSSVEVNYYVPSENSGDNTDSGDSSSNTDSSTAASGIDESSASASGSSSNTGTNSSQSVIDTSTSGSMLDTEAMASSESEASLDEYSAQSSNSASVSSSTTSTSSGVTVPLVACVALAAVGAVVVFMRRVR